MCPQGVAEADFKFSPHKTQLLLDTFTETMFSALLGALRENNLEIKSHKT